MKKILAITGIRSEIEYLLPIIEMFKKDSFDVSIVLSGGHLSSWHGDSLKQIENKNIRIADKIDSLFNTNRKTQRVKGIGILTYGLSQTIEREKPDFILVVGDREESIAAALIGNYMDILVAHIGGGDPVYGNADDPIRHAVSSLANIHFTLNKQYQNILFKMGEEKFRIFNVGSPSLDKIKREENIDITDIGRQLNIDISGQDYIILIKHPLSSEVNASYYQMRITLESIEKFCVDNNLKCIGIYPNTDPGSVDMIKAINEFSESQNIKFYKNLERKLFINVIRNALCLIGNSSMGVLEAPFFELPVVNVGNRQKGRINAGNIVFTDYTEANIINELNHSCFDKHYRKQVTKNKYFYGDGNTCEKISKVLQNINTEDRKWYNKMLNYLSLEEFSNERNNNCNISSPR